MRVAPRELRGIRAGGMLARFAVLGPVAFGNLCLHLAVKPVELGAMLRQFDVQLPSRRLDDRRIGAGRWHEAVYIACQHGGEPRRVAIGLSKIAGNPHLVRSVRGRAVSEIPAAWAARE